MGAYCLQLLELVQDGEHIFGGSLFCAGLGCCVAGSDDGLEVGAIYNTEGLEVFQGLVFSNIHVIQEEGLTDLQGFG